MIWLDIIAFNMIDGIEFFYINGHIDRATPAVFLKGQASVIRPHLFCAWNAQRSVITNIYNLTFMLSARLELMTWNAFVESCETSSAVCNIYRGRALPRCCSVRRRNEITIATSTGQVPRGVLFCSVLQPFSCMSCPWKSTSPQGSKKSFHKPSAGSLCSVLHILVCSAKAEDYCSVGQYLS